VVAAAAPLERVSPELALVDAALAERLRADLDHPTESVQPVRRDLRIVQVESTLVDVESQSEAAGQLDASDLIVVEDGSSEPESTIEEVLPSDELDLDTIADLDSPAETNAPARPELAVEEEPTESDLEPAADVPGGGFDASDLIVAVEEVPTEPESTIELAPLSEVVDLESAAIEAGVDASDLIVDAHESEAGEPTTSSLYPARPAPVVVGEDPMDAAEAVLREIRDRLTTPAPAQRRRRFRRRFIVASGLSTAVALGVVAANAALGVTQLPV